MEDLLIYELVVWSYLSAIEVDNVFIKLKFLYLLMELCLVSYACVLNLFAFGKIENYKFLV